MGTVIAELDELINLLEAKIPANPNSLANRKLAKGLERELAKYFRALQDAFPFDQLDQLYYKYVKESLGPETGNMLDSLLAAFDVTLTTQVDGRLAETYISGSAEMVSWGRTKGGVPIAYEGPPISQAVNWAAEHGAALVTQMDEETKRRLAQVVSDGVANKRGIPGLSRDIRREFSDMSRYRSVSIARTETASALSRASLDRMEDMGIDGKEWIPGGEPCEICQENAAVGVIGAKDAFPSGDDAPPAHPNCECAVAPAKLPEGREPKLRSYADLTNAQSGTLADWVGSSQSVRNAQLAGKSTRLTRNFEAILNDVAQYKGTAYRGMRLSDSAFEQLASSKRIALKAVASASQDLKIAKKFSFVDIAAGKTNPVILRIESKTAANLSTIRAVPKAELEVILRKGTNYRVVKVEVIPGDPYGRVMIYLVEV